MEALGVEKNPDPLPGSLDVLQCRNGLDTIVEDYKTVPGWDNPYIQNHVVQPLQGALMAVSTIIRRNRVSSEIGFQSLTACTSSWKSENRKVSPNSYSSRREAGKVKNPIQCRVVVP